MGVLAKLSSGSVVAFRALYELNISSILKDILSTYDLSHGMSSNHVVDGHCNQVYKWIFWFFSFSRVTDSYWILRMSNCVFENVVTYYSFFICEMITDFQRKCVKIFCDYKISMCCFIYNLRKLNGIIVSICLLQVYEVLKLLNELLPTSTRDQENPQLSDKESLLVNQPDLLQKFGMDILPLLTQVLFLIIHGTLFALHPASE